MLEESVPQQDDTEPRQEAGKIKSLREQPYQTKSKTSAQTIIGEHELCIKGYSLLKGLGDGEPIASEKFNVGGHEWVLLFYPDGKRSQADQNIAHHAQAANRLPAQILPQPLQPPANDPAGQHPPQPAQNPHPQENVQVIGRMDNANMVVQANDWQVPAVMAPPQPTPSQHAIQALLQHGHSLQPLGRSSRRDAQHNDYCALFVALIGEGPHPLGVVNTNDGKVVRAFHRFTLVDQTGATKGLEKGRKREDGAVKISCSRADPNARNCHGYRKFVKKTTLEDPAKGYVMNDQIIIRYTIELVVTQGGVFQKQVPYTKRETQMRTLAEDFADLYESGHQADLTVVVDDGTEFKAHRLVLAARSKVFEVMLNSDMQEGKADTIAVTDMEKDIFQAMLHYIYCDKLPSIFDDDSFTFAVAQHLMVAADRYGLKGLRALCEARLEETIDLDTVMQTLDLAWCTHADDLKQRCLDFIAYSLEYLINTDGYVKVLKDNTALLNELNMSVAKLGYASTATNKVYGYAPRNGQNGQRGREGQAGVKEEGNEEALNPRKRQRREG